MYIKFKGFMRILTFSAFLFIIFTTIQPQISMADFFTNLNMDEKKDPGLTKFKEHIDNRTVPSSTPDGPFKNANCLNNDVIVTMDDYVSDVRDGRAAAAYKDLDTVYEAFKEYEHKDLILGRADKLNSSFGACGPGAETQPISSTLSSTSDELLQRFLENSELKFEKSAFEKPEKNLYRRLVRFFRGKVKASPSEATQFVVAREDLEKHMKDHGKRIDEVNKLFKADTVDPIELYRGLAGVARATHFYYRAVLNMAEHDHYLPVLKRLNGTQYSLLNYPDLPQLSSTKRKRAAKEGGSTEIWSEDKTSDFNRCREQLDLYFSNIIRYCEDQIASKQTEKMPKKATEASVDAPAGDSPRGDILENSHGTSSDGGKDQLKEL